ncbi:MAG: hypothetical protein JWO82_2680, partial [Akkermansiaceae bacterium]|nr:hypothetical protein [Akkermansiaceae bacterium]
TLIFSSRAGKILRYQGMLTLFLLSLSALLLTPLHLLWCLGVACYANRAIHDPLVHADFGRAAQLPVELSGFFGLPLVAAGVASAAFGSEPWVRVASGILAVFPLLPVFHFDPIRGMDPWRVRWSAGLAFGGGLVLIFVLLYGHYHGFRQMMIH